MGALIGEPSFLIADEVTTALDVETKMEIVKFLKGLQKKLNISILFITHDLSTLKNFADKIYVMYHGLIENNYFNFLKMFGGENNNAINCGKFN